MTDQTIEADDRIIRETGTDQRVALQKARAELLEQKESLDAASLAAIEASGCAEAPSDERLAAELAASGTHAFSGRDVTKIPAALDAELEKLDTEGALRPVIINVGKEWKKRETESLLAPLKEKRVGVDQQKLERNTCYDLLDALTKSGSEGYGIEGASLHVVIASTHCFDKSVMNTLVQDNVNPVAKVEHSQLIVASHIHGKKPEELLEQGASLKRIKEQSPALF